MSDNTTGDPGSGGDTFRLKDRTAVKTQIVGLDLNISGSEQLMATAALADATTNPTTAPWAGMLMCFNGTTWDRIRGDTTSGMWANVKASALPSGASTAAKQPALGTAGSASADVITVQGIASGTVIPISDGGGSVTVDGTVTATGPLTDTQLRASAVPVSLASAPSTAVTNAGTFAVQADTELPAAAALADTTSNPTVPGVGAFGLLWNGATWDRAPGGATNGLTANLKALNGTTVDTNSGSKSAGTLRVTLATDQVQPTNAFKVDPSAVTSPVSIATAPALVAGSALIGRVNLDPQTANGLSVFHLVSAASTNATNIKASAGQVYGWKIYNSNAAARKVVFHNTAGTPTAGASVFFAIMIPPTSAANVSFDMGLAFSTGIAITTVTDLTDAGTTAVAASDLIINIFYK